MEAELKVSGAENPSDALYERFEIIWASKGRRLSNLFYLTICQCIAETIVAVPIKDSYVLEQHSHTYVSWQDSLEHAERNKGRLPTKEEVRMLIVQKAEV